MSPDGLHSPAVHQQGGIAHHAFHRAGVLRVIAGPDSPLTVYQHEIRSSGNGVADGIDWSGEKGPHPGTGPVLTRVRSEPGGIVEPGIHADRHEVEGRLEVPRAGLDPSHLPGDDGAVGPTARKNEARQPDAPGELLGAEPAAVRRGELECRDSPEDGQSGWHWRPKCPPDRPRGNERDEHDPVERVPDRSAYPSLDAIAKRGSGGGWHCTHRARNRRSDTGSLVSREVGGEA
jgi:hypothetical protein